MPLHACDASGLSYLDKCTLAFLQAMLACQYEMKCNYFIRNNMCHGPVGHGGRLEFYCCTACLHTIYLQSKAKLNRN